MKNKIIIFCLFILIITGSCGEDFLNREPLGALSESVLQDPDGVEGILIGAYAALHGWTGAETGNAWLSAITNWVYGDVRADDAYKGSNAGDQQDIVPIERYSTLPLNPYFDSKWRSLYDGVSRTNDVLRILPDVEMIEERKNNIEAQARFLRAFFHFEAKKMWNKVPWVDETVNSGVAVGNDRDIWPNINEDLLYAIENLPESQSQIGRVTKGAAQSLLAKAFMFQNNYAAAKPLLEAVINSGRYALVDCFHQNFNAEHNNNVESIFQVQFSVNDGTQGENGNYGNVLNYPYSGGPGECCGFFQPSQNLVNAYQTENGLPLIYNFNQTQVNNDQGLFSNEDFTPHEGALDPRLDWTVGRRGIPYLGWGDHPGRSWIRDQVFGGPYSPKKHVFTAEQDRVLSSAVGWAKGASANNYSIIRYADVLLMAAEVAVEENNLELAREYVNLIRARARDGCVVTREDGTPAANYVINIYIEPWTNPIFARDAVRFERRLELAMEGHRSFDLVRWGIASEVLNTYVQSEQQLRIYLNGAVFDQGVDEYYPIPQNQIILSTVGGQELLKQNPGY